LSSFPEKDRGTRRKENGKRDSTLKTMQVNRTDPSQGQAAVHQSGKNKHGLSMVPAQLGKGTNQEKKKNRPSRSEKVGDSRSSAIGLLRGLQETEPNSEGRNGKNWGPQRRDGPCYHIEFILLIIKRTGRRGERGRASRASSGRG